MNKKSTILILLALLIAPALLAAPAAADEPLAARTFQFRYRDASQAAVVIKPLISASGSVSIQPSTNTLVITDSPAVLLEIAKALRAYDAPPQAFRIEVKLVAASRAAAPAPPVAEDLREIASKLSGVLRLNRFEKLGEVSARANEGEPVLTGLDTVYRAEFEIGEFDPVSQTIRLEQFRLTRLPEGSGDVLQLLKPTTINMRLDQTHVIGASRLPNSDRILMLVLVASRGE